MAGNRRVFFIFIIIAISLLVGVLFYLFLPSAEIVLYVPSEPLAINLTVKLDQNVQQLLTNLQTIPARTIQNTWRKKNIGLDENVLIEQGINKLKLTIPEGWQLINGLTNTEINQEFINDEIVAVIKTQGLIFQSADLQQVIDYYLSLMVTDNQAVINTLVDPLIYEVQSYKPTEGQALVIVNLQKLVKLQFDFQKIKQSLVKQDLAAAEEYLRDLDGVQDVSIKTTHCWQDKLPLVSGRIKITIIGFDN